MIGPKEPRREQIWRQGAHNRFREYKGRWTRRTSKKWGKIKTVKRKLNKNEIADGE